MHHEPPDLSPLLRLLGDTAPAVVSFLWLVLVAIALVCWRRLVRDALAALVDRLRGRGEVEAFGVRLGAMPEATVSTLPDSLRGVAGGGDHADHAALGAFARHAGMRTFIGLGPAPFQQIRDARSVAQADAEALAHVNAVLAGRARGETVLGMVPHDEAACACLQENASVVAVGGPMTNPLTARLMRHLVPRLAFASGALTDEASGQRWPSQTLPDGGVQQDIVLVTGGPHPKHAKGWCTALAACHGPGVIPAVNRLLQADEGDLWGAEATAAGYLVVVSVSFADSMNPVATVVQQHGLGSI